MDRLLAIWQARNEGSRRFCNKWYELDIESALGGDCGPGYEHGVWGFGWEAGGEVMSPVEGGYCLGLHLIVSKVGWFEFFVFLFEAP